MEMVEGSVCRAKIEEVGRDSGGNVMQKIGLPVSLGL